jgi:hypothetical protein
VHERLYEEGKSHGDSDIIAALIEETTPKGVDIIFVFLKDGLNATMHLRPPHNASWNITWNIKTANRLDTGDEIDPYPYLANPDCQHILIEQFNKIYKKMRKCCDCQGCRPPL